ncbi:MAG: transposase [Deltaproteobacteria bacterium]|nr:transposase [Deltaproteobacteria bacterium]
MRRYFLYDRKLLSDLSRCGWEALKLYLTKAVKENKAVPGACVAIQSFGISHAAQAPALRVRASFSQERMTYIQDEAKVVYQSKDGKDEKVFDALEWIAAMCSHVPNKGEQMVRYYGNYSNVSRGHRKKAQTDDQIPYILAIAQAKSES